MKNNFFGKSFTSVEGLMIVDIELFFEKASQMRLIIKTKGWVNSLEGKVLNALFYEPTTRTFSSFAAAMQKLGGSVVPNRDISSTSVSKGETLEDTIRVLSYFSDAIVMRHPDSGAARVAARISKVPVINGGDGINEHPVHALHDLWTIKEFFGRLENLNITMVGDIGHYRNVNSLAKLLTLYNVHMTFVSTRECALQDSVRKYLEKGNCSFSEITDLKNVIRDTDVLYVTRVKKEYMTPRLYQKTKTKYIIDETIVSHMKKKSIIMHPLPRVDEITTGVDSDPRAIYLSTQLENGLYGKMALLDLVLKI